MLSINIFTGVETFLRLLKQHAPGVKKNVTNQLVLRFFALTCEIHFLLRKHEHFTLLNWHFPFVQLRWISKSLTIENIKTNRYNFHELRTYFTVTKYGDSHIDM